MLIELFRIRPDWLGFVSHKLVMDRDLFPVFRSGSFDGKECSNFVVESSPMALTGLASASVTLQVCAQLTYLKVVDGN